MTRRRDLARRRDLSVTDEELIARYMQHQGVTRCPPAYCAPTSTPPKAISAADHAAWKAYQDATFLGVPLGANRRSPKKPPGRPRKAP